jgi:hypothetical protein
MVLTFAANFSVFQEREQLILVLTAEECDATKDE